MKKSAIFLIVVSILILILTASFVYHILYFKNFKGETRQISEEEKQKVIEILNKSGINYSQIKFGIAYPWRDKDIIQVELVAGNSKEHYFVNILSEKVVKK